MNREKLFLELYQELINGKSLAGIMKYYEKFTEEELTVLVEFCQLVRQQLLNQSYFKMPGDLDGELLLTNLLMGVRVNEQLVKQNLFPTAGSKGRCYCIYVFGINNSDEKNFFPNLHKMLEKRIPLSIGVCFKNYIVVLRCLKNAGNLSEVLEVSEFMQSQNMHCGVSNTFSDINQTEVHFIQAEKALVYSAYQPEGQLVARYEEYAFFHMLEYVNEKCDLSLFLDMAMVRLLDYDKEYKTNYFKDIFIYYQSGGDVQLTAKMMGIHRNTVRYRISKIESILGGSLADPGISFRLRISIQILYFLRGRGFYAEFSLPETP